MKKLIIIILLVFMCSSLYSQAVLDLYPDALSSSLNGAGDTIIRNSYAIYNNPANLIFLFYNELTVSYMHFIDDIKRGTVTYAWKSRNLPPFCVDMSCLSYGSIKQFTIGESEYSIIEGEDLQLWYFNSGFSSSKRIFFLNNYFLVGGKIDFLINHLDKSHIGVLLHSGIIYYTDFKGLAFSLVLNNIGLIDSFKDTAPLKLKPGIGYKIKKYETELNFNIGGKQILKWGNRISLFSVFKLLIGIKFDKDESLQNNINIGGELNFKKLSAHYTIVPKSELGYYHYFSVKREF